MFTRTWKFTEQLNWPGIKKARMKIIALGKMPQFVKERSWNSPNFGGLFRGEKKIVLLAEEKKTQYKVYENSCGVLEKDSAWIE